MNNSRLCPRFFFLESTATLNDPLALRNNTQDEVLWRSLSYGETGLCSDSYPGDQASGLLQMLGFQCPHFVWETTSLCLAW